jgi:hypothetical protein
MRKGTLVRWCAVGLLAAVSPSCINLGISGRAAAAETAAAPASDARPANRALASGDRRVNRRGNAPVV